MDPHQIFSFLLCHLLFLISYRLLFSTSSWAFDKIKYLPVTLGIKRNDRTPETANNVGGESSSTSNTLNSSPECKYDVFLSFAEHYTRSKFTDHLYDALRRGGINAFRVKEGIMGVQDISDQAIKDSLCAVVVLCENYAGSTWCLKQLQMILECRTKLGQQVFPIFYQRHNFGEVLAKHEKKFGRDEVQNWRNALSEIGSIDGWTTSGRHEVELIKAIVGKVSTYLSAKLPYDDNLVGIESRVRDMETILEIGLDDKRVVGIWGIGGVGKTTLARAVYRKICCKFEVCCFIVNVRETLQKEGLVSLQEKLFSYDFKIKKINDRYEGEEMIRKYLSNKMVLLVLDDVDNRSQLDNLAESPYWFGKGSRILITTRDSHLLTLAEVGQRKYEMKTMEKDESFRLFSNNAFKKDHPEEGYWEFSKSVVEYARGLPLGLKVLGSFFYGRSKAEWIDALDRLKKIPNKDILQVFHVSYDAEVGQRKNEMKTMEKDESLRLFSNNAFKKDHPEDGYWEFSKSVVEYARGLPLTLNVLGSYFYGRSKAEWIDGLERLKQIPNKDILQVLHISYDGLNEEEKTIFLDIACFFKGWLKKEVTQILKSCDLDPTIGIKVLIEKALLVETKDCTLEMDDLIQELGRHIVHQESRKDVCKRSRLWKFKDIEEVLKNNKGSEAVQAIAIQGRMQAIAIRGRMQVHLEVFSKMSSIRLLLLDVTKDKMDETDETNCPRFKLPSTLKVFQWPSFPFEVLPLETPLNELVRVKMHNSRIKQLWNVIQPMKMKFIDLSDSKYFIETPDFSGVPCLEHLRLRSCKSLVKVHPSLGELKELVEVDLHGCLKLEILPRKLKTNSLLKLDLGGCEKVAALPKFGKGMEKLSYLDVSGTAITRLPESFGTLIGLRYLNLMGCKICNLEKFSLKVMTLTELYLGGCGLNDGPILDDFGSLSSLIILNLDGNDFVNLPTACFSSLSRLLFLSLAHCKKLKSLPRLPPRLIRLNASHCDSMEPLSSDRQLWNLVASLDHEYRGQIEYVVSEEEYGETPPIFKHSELEHLPLRDFFAIVPGCKIPSWFPNKYVLQCGVNYFEHEIEVKIPPCLLDRGWFGIVVCVHLSDDFDGVISWSSKAPEDDDYIRKEWAHLSTIKNGQNPHLGIMVLKLNEKTCWQHLEAGGNSLHIKLYARNHGIGPYYRWCFSRRLLTLECGWRVICKEEMQKWCNDNDLSQLTPPQLATPRDEVKLPSRLLDQLYGSAYAQWSRDDVQWSSDDVEEDVSDDSGA